MPSLSAHTPPPFAGVFRRGANEWEIYGFNLKALGHFKLMQTSSGLPGDGPYQPPIGAKSAGARSEVRFQGGA